MGGWGKKEAAETGAGADVSSEGTLVWVRRPNGTWWPGRVISPVHVPDGCAAPPRAPAAATPIMLLGRRNGPAVVDWCNLERTKRVRPFRCGEFDFDERISKAQEHAARRRAAARSKASGRYSCKEDAILQALQIERSHFRPRMVGGVVTTKSSHAATATATATAPPSPKRKRKTPNDSEDDVPQGFRRMRDLSDIGFNTVPNRIPITPTFSDCSLHLPSTPQVKRTKQSHPASATKRKMHAVVDQDQSCGGYRKRDRSRPLSELCNGNAPNGFKPSVRKNDERSLDMGSCSGSSSGTSSLDTTILDEPRSRHRGASKADQAKGTGICMTGSRIEYFPCGDNFVDTPGAGGSVLQADHSLQTYQHCALTKDPISKCDSQGTDCNNASKVDISPQYDRRKIKKKTTSSVGHEDNDRTGNTLEHEHCKARAVKYKAPSNEVVFFEEKVDMSSVSKPTEAGDNKELVISPADLDCVGVVLQQCSESKCEHEKSSGTMSNHSNCENVSASSLVFELPLQVLPPQQKALKPSSWRAVKPTKTLHLNSALYDVDLSVQGSNSTGRRVPLVSLMSRWNTRPVVGYPVSVEVLDDVCCFPASSIDDHHPATSSGNGQLKKDNSAGRRCMRSSSHTDREKLKNRSRIWEHEMDKLWQPHTKKPVSSSRKMRRLSSFGIMGARGGEDRKSVVGEMSGPAIACIPLRVVFSRIHEALSYPVK